MTRPLRPGRAPRRAEPRPLADGDLGAARLPIVAAAVLLAVVAGTVAFVAASPASVGPSAEGTAAHPSAARAATSLAAPVAPPAVPAPAATAAASDAPEPVLFAVAPEAVAVEPLRLGELTPKELKKIAKLEKKIAKKEKKEDKARDKYFEWQAALEEAEADVALLATLVAQAEADLAAAEAMPADTPDQIAARKAAIKLAKKGLQLAKKEHKKALKRRKKAAKKLGKFADKIAKFQGQQLVLLLAIEEIDPGHDGVPVLDAVGGVGSVTFTWTTPAEAEGFNVYLDTEPGVDPLEATLVAEATSPLVVPGLPPGSTLYGVVAAVVGGTEGEPSNEMGATAAPAPDPPSDLEADLEDDDVTLTWSAPEDVVSQQLYWSDEPNVTTETGTLVPDVTSPHVMPDLGPGTWYFVVTVTDAIGESEESNEVHVIVGGEEPVASGSEYDPPWADVEPTNVIVLDHDPGLSDEQNGADLRAAVLGLQPGDRLEVGGGTWSIVPKFTPAMVGTAAAPIWVVAQEGETPVITRPDASQNLMNPECEYVCFRGLEFTGGSAGIKFGAARHVWIDDCHIHDVGEAGIAANSADTESLYITRNHVHDTSGYAEGMYLGANNGAHVMSNSVIALNHVHDTTNGLQGDGIEIKQGSWGNWVAENLVHDTKYPCLLVYGTGGQPANVIERNVLIGSQDNVLQVQGEAVVRNNLIMNGAQGFQSGDHQGTVTELVFVHNTIINAGKAARLSDWAGKPGMVFANNAVYSNDSQSIDFVGGSAGVTIEGNIVWGSTANVPQGGYVVGSGLGDFQSVSWDGMESNAAPSAGSSLLGAASAAWAPEVDLDGEPRQAPHDAGCLDG